MKLQSLTPNIMVGDVNKTLDFYIDKLGFKLLQTVPEAGNFEWAFVSSGEVKIMFQQEASLKREYKELSKYKNGGGLTLYVRVDDVDQWYAQIKDKTNVIKPMNKTFYGANEFAIMDLNGFIITFSDILE